MVIEEKGVDMKCTVCNSEIESDDNFCHHCGHWTARGYIYFNQSEEHLKILDGNVNNSKNKMITLFVLISLLVIIFVVISIIRGNAILKPFVYIKKQILNSKYGYSTSVIITDRQYNKFNVDNLNDAFDIIEKDISTQAWQCADNLDIYHIEEELKEQYDIKSISFCDMRVDEVKKIKKVIEQMFLLFPNVRGYLDTISITNANSKDDYIAYYQPIYQFVNRNEDIKKYNKVNKSQMLLNSYYYLNDDMLSKKISEIIGDNFYVKDANWESIIAHEFGHFITYVSLLKQKNIGNMTFITKENEKLQNDILFVINNHSYSTEIVEMALNNYNNKYNQSLDITLFMENISKYATVSADEAIAEAVHDYYLHYSAATPYSLEVINVLKKNLGEFYD